MGFFSRLRARFSRKKTTTIKSIPQSSPPDSTSTPTQPTPAPNFQPAPTGNFTPAPTFRGGGGGSSGGGSSSSGGSSTPAPIQTLAPTQSIPSSTLAGRAAQSKLPLATQRARERILEVKAAREAQSQNIIASKDFDRRFKELEAQSIGGQTLRTGESEFFLKNEQLSTPKPQVKTTRQKIAEVGRTFVNPVGLTQDQRKLNLVSGGLIVPQERIDEARELQPIRTDIALNLPSPSEIIAFSTFGAATAAVRGEAAIKTTKNPKIFKVDVAARATDPLGRGSAVTISRQAVADVKGGSVGIGIAGTISKTGRGTETIVSKLAGVAKETGVAKLVTTIPKTKAVTSKVVGKSFVSTTLVQDILKTTTRRGIRIGVPKIEQSILKEAAKREQISGVIKQGQAENVATFIGTPRIKPLRDIKILKPQGIVSKQRGRLDIPDIKIDIGFGKFPSDKGQTANFIKKIGGSGGRGRQVSKLTNQVSEGVVKAVSTTSIKAIAALKPQVARSIARQSSARASLGLTKVKTPTLRAATAPRAITSQIFTPRLKNIPTIKTSGGQFGGSASKSGQIPRAALANAQVDKQDQRQRQRLRQKQEQRQQPLLKAANIQKQNQRFTLRLRQKQILEPRLSRITIPRIPTTTIKTPVLPFFKIGLPLGKGKKGKKKRAKDDFGLSESFIQRQLLLKLPKGLR